MWPHHHEHRLLHSSFGLAAVFLAAACWLGTTALWYESRADTVTGSGNATLTAQVGIIDEGPVTTTSGGASYPPTPLPNLPPTPSERPNLAPNIIAVGDTPEVLRVPGEDPIYVFRTPYPSFSGSVNISDAIVLFEVHSDTLLKGATVVDSSTRWQWKTSEKLPDGDHTLLIKAYSRSAPNINAMTTLKFRIDVTGNTPATQKPLNIAPPTRPYTGTNQPNTGAETPEYFILTKITQGSKKIQPGEPITVLVEILGPRNNQTLAWPFTYTIANNKDEIVAKVGDTVQVSGGSSFYKLLYTAPNIPEDEYRLTVGAATGSQIISSSDTFLVTGKPVVSLAAGIINLNIIYLSLFLLGLAFLLIAYFEYRQYIKISRLIHELSEKDLANAHFIQ